MSVPNTRQMKRRPTHPGEMLREDFMPDYGLTVVGLAESVGVSRQSINELLRGRRAVSPEMALRLSCLFGNSAEFWLNAQRAVDLWDAAKAIGNDMLRIKPLCGREWRPARRQAPLPDPASRRRSGVVASCGASDRRG